MQDTFQWTDELFKEFVETNRGEILTRQMAIDFIASKSPKKEPVLVTVDGVEIFEDREVTVVYLADHSYSIGPLSGYHPDELNENKVFADDDKAQKYILENKPLLSLNDVKKIGEHSDQAKALAELTTLVKQKLNQ